MVLGEIVGIICIGAGVFTMFKGGGGAAADATHAGASATHGGAERGHEPAHSEHEAQSEAEAAEIAQQNAQVQHQLVEQTTARVQANERIIQEIDQLMPATHRTPDGKNRIFNIIYNRPIGNQPLTTEEAQIRDDRRPGSLRIQLAAKHQQFMRNLQELEGIFANMRDLDNNLRSRVVHVLNDPMREAA